MKKSELFILAARCLVMDDDPSALKFVRDKITSGEVNWEVFVWMCSSHFVLPTVFTAFRRNGLLPLLPPDLAEYIEQIYNLSDSRNEKIIQQCMEIISLLHAHNIEPVFLKGAGHLLSGMYHERGDRIMVDIDFLVPEKDILTTIIALKNAGYTEVTEYTDEDYYKFLHHTKPLYNPLKAASLEIHKMPLTAKFKKVLDAKSVFFNKVRDIQTGAYIPSLIHRQILHFLHEYHHLTGYLSSIGLLRGLFDFYLMAKYRKPQSNDLLPGRIYLKYKKYCNLTQSIFNTYIFSENSILKKSENPFKKEIYLISHPGWEIFYNKYVYRSFYLIGLLIRSVFSNEIRKIQIRKIKRKLRGYQNSTI